MKVKELVVNSLVACVAAGIGLLICEAGLRLTRNPADYLTVKMIRDDVLGIRIAPRSAGFDDWGFRNARVPETADIVAVGDSHTFGNTAAMDDAWPAVVARDLDRSVYNLALGGYGPNQYYQLLKTRAFQLHPRQVVCGLYMGDDFENAFSITYGLSYWASLRNGEFGAVDPDIWEPSQGVGWTKSARVWLSESSMVYRLLVNGPILGQIKEAFRFAQLARGGDPVTTVLVAPDKNIREAFRPMSLARRLDQDSAAVREGMRITFNLLSEMNRLCHDNGCRLTVAVIPTKEMVFSDYLQSDSQIHLHDAVLKLLTNERLARTKLFAFLDQAGIPYVDTLPALKAANGRQLYARTTEDMHPGRNGYKVIGDAVAAFLKQERHD